MIPKSLSASSMDVAELCMARWEAEYFNRGRGISNDAASLGTAVHGALEMYVTKCIIASEFPATEKQLLEFFKMSYMATFGTANFDGEDYSDGVGMLKAWHKRTDFSTFEVRSCEVKESFLLKTTAGPIPFNYIWDRFDYLGNGEWRVVDYKTNRWRLSPDQLKKKVQARAYGVAAAIKLKSEQPSKIWVEFDMLRHEGPIGILFTREDNAAMWKFMQDTAERIIDTPEGKAEETLNQACNFCVRKTTCEALRKNIKVGGVFSHGTDINALVDLRAELENQAKAVNAAIAELDSIILPTAREQELFMFESELNEMTITVSAYRNIDPDRAALVIGDDLMSKYGNRKLTMGAVDKMLKGNELTEEQKKQLRSLIYKNPGEPKVKVTPKNVID